MAGQRLGRRAGDAFGKQRRDRQAFHGVVVLGRGAVQVQVVDLPGLQMRAAKGFVHRLQSAATARLRRGNMVRIRAGARPQQGDARAFAALFAHHEQYCCFADIDAVAVGGKRIAAFI